jgi:hypothetical protein
MALIKVKAERIKVKGMKKSMKIIIVALAVALMFPVASKAQSIADDLAQLALDYQKLSGLKSILKQMYTGYEVVTKGYNAVKDISKGSFSLQEAFLDGLMIVSPIVRQYPRVAGIINDQAMLISEYKSAYSLFKNDPHFNPDEIGYMMDVYNNLISGSLKNLNDLSMIITDSKVRMSDAERIRAIDRIYADSHGQLTFLRQFNNQSYSVALQRSEAAGDRQTLKTLYGIN